MLNQAVTLPLGIPGIPEMWPILVVVLLLFGAKKLPELARAMGSSIGQFKKGIDEEKRDKLPPKDGDGDGDGNGGDGDGDGEDKHGGGGDAG